MKSETVHVLDGCLLHGKDFAAFVPERARRLHDRCGLKGVRKFSRATVARIDRYWMRLDREKIAANPQFFSELVAYVGEAIRRELEGAWDVRGSRLYPGSWEPWLTFGARGEVPIAVLVLEALVKYRDASLANVMAYVTSRE